MISRFVTYCIPIKATEHLIRLSFVYVIPQQKAYHIRFRPAFENDIRRYSSSSATLLERARSVNGHSTNPNYRRLPPLRSPSHGQLGRGNVIYDGPDASARASNLSRRSLKARQSDAELRQKVLTTVTFGATDIFPFDTTMSLKDIHVCTRTQGFAV